MKTTNSGLILPDMPNMTKKTIMDFEPVSPQELHQNMVEPINQALQQGVPESTPTAIPIDAMARLLKTMLSMAETLTISENTLRTIMDDETIPDDVKQKLKILPLVRPSIDDILGEDLKMDAPK